MDVVRVGGRWMRSGWQVEEEEEENPTRQVNLVVTLT